MDNMKPNKFAYSGGFKETCTSLLKTFDKCLMELNSVVSGKTTAPDEYAVCNAEYKFRYISPDNIAEFASNLMKVIVGDMISTRVADVEKFSVESATRFVGENDCDPFNWTTIMATGNYPSNSMTLNDLLVYCQNEFFAHTVLSKYEMDERRNLISKDFKTLSDLHISSNIGKIIDKLPVLMEKADLVKYMNDTQRNVVMAFIEQFIKFAISLNISTVVSMINFCVPRSTYNTALQSHEAKVTSNSLLDDKYFNESNVDHFNGYVTECCLLKTNDINFNNKLPFNINMRNIVLQDMHPNFKDTVSAINFLLKDNRSPFSLMIQKYGTVDFKHNIDPDTIVRMFIGNPCCKFDNFSNYSEIYNRLDFHSDVNWLDKITYGDVYQASNYRRDALGNDNKHPIQVSLEMLYQMYCPCKCKTNEDLANNIRSVGEAMIGIAKIYKECGIENWELVRDILAVMGEIMTKCMIRLYNNHMAVIVAADAMDDTIVPGYMYNEYFVMEADDDANKPKVDVNAKANNTLNNANAKVTQKAAAYAAKGKEWIRKTVQAFIGWVNDKLAKSPMNFINNHKAETDWVKNHDTLNKQIASSIQSNQFNPHVENWPLYKIPAKALTDENIKLSAIIKDIETKPNEISIQKIKENFYGKFQGLDVKNVMNISNEKDQNKRDNSGERDALTNWVLYSNSNPQQTTANQLTPELWNTLIEDIQNVGPVLTKIGKHMETDIKACLDDINKRLNNVKEQNQETNQSSSSETKTESYEDTNTYGDLFMEDGEEGLSQQQLQTMFNAVQDIANVWCVGIQNALDKNFYRTSYTLYKDVIAAYRQSNGNNTTDQNADNKNANGEPPASESTGKNPSETGTPDQSGQPT